ncbi:MAG TPA: hypothetical protein P5186_14900 [Candidatus Paceibacterota bacterium]|nr:hypothetical protein [Verrucomicrobiota bacterium]HRY49335.1 hypothetical protein [Candidatus Paceibacterota bacterium]HRZ57799.1 hypothetical protein [Candidatus Paceibacterota bacterium]
MNLNKTFRLIALGACLLGLSALASQKNPVARPYKDYGQAILVVNLQTGYFEGTILTHGTHIGLATITMVGHMDLETSTVDEIEATVTAANGDQLFIELIDGVNKIVDGTGRFEGATGELSSGEFIDLQATTDYPYMTMTYGIKTEGTLIY